MKDSGLIFSDPSLLHMKPCPQVGVSHLTIFYGLYRMAWPKNIPVVCINMDHATHRGIVIIVVL